MAPPRPTRARILAAASDLYLREGDAALSMRRVAVRIGVSATAIYRHFPDRARLVDAILDGAFGVFESYLLRALPPGRRPTGLAPLRRIMRQYLEFALRKPRLFEVLFLRRRAALRKFPEDFARNPSRTFELLHDTVAGAVASGALRRDLDTRELALAIWTHGHGFAAQHWQGRFGSDPAPVRARFNAYMNLILEGCLP